jgi:Protein of unknown function (DUF3489)/DnaJ domain
MTIELTNYSNASNARRAAKAAGLSEFDVYKGAGGYKIRVAALKAAKRWWGILGVAKTATKKDILAAYRTLAVKRHPDKGGDTAMMKELNLARDAGLKVAPEAPKTAQNEPKANAGKPGKATKATKLINLITEGATITELTEALGWQKHTVRAALCRLSKAGHPIRRTKVATADGFESHYKSAA